MSQLGTPKAFLLFVVAINTILIFRRKEQQMESALAEQKNIRHVWKISETFQYVRFFSSTFTCVCIWSCSLMPTICPFKFYNNKKYSNKVFELIHRKFDKKFLFTIESLKLNNSKFASIDCKNKNLNIIYKIIDMEGLVPI